MFKLKQLEKTWTNLDFSNGRSEKALAPKPRWGATLSYVDNKLYLIGGFNGNKIGSGDVEAGFLSEIMEYDLNRQSWKYIFPKGTQFHARSNHGSVVVQEKYEFVHQNLHLWGRRKTEKIQRHSLL